MHPPIDLFELETTGETLIVRPVANLGEFEFESIEAEVAELLKLLDKADLRNVVVDFRRCAYFGSSAVSALLRIAHAVRERGGDMVLSDLSKCEQEMLDVLHLGEFWTIKSSATAAA